MHCHFCLKYLGISGLSFPGDALCLQPLTLHFHRTGGVWGSCDSSSQEKGLIHLGTRWGLSTAARTFSVLSSPPTFGKAEVFVHASRETEAGLQLGELRSGRLWGGPTLATDHVRPPCSLLHSEGRFQHLSFSALVCITLIHQCQRQEGQLLAPGL